MFVNTPPVLHPPNVDDARRFITGNHVPSSRNDFKGGLPKYKLRQAFAFIQTNLSDTLTLAKIAAELNMSVFHFARLFKQETGQTPNEYITRQRIEHAEVLVRCTKLPVTEICYRVGFESQSHFTMLFRRVTGVTPGAYRKFYRR